MSKSRTSRRGSERRDKVRTELARGGYKQETEIERKEVKKREPTARREEKRAAELRTSSDFWVLALSLIMLAAWIFGYP